MVKKNNTPSFLLFASSGALMTAGWLMAPFPFLIFLGLAPLFALSDRAETGSPVLEKMEYMLVAIGISFVSFAAIHGNSVVGALITSIVMTLPFVAHAWVRQVLGSRTGKITIVLFWLAAEYILLQVDSGSGLFLADTMRFQPAWTRWNVNTGYLGGSLWILLGNWCVYYTFLSASAIRWKWFPLVILLLLGPILYSYQLVTSPITREDMVNLYEGSSSHPDVAYLARGEFIVRTSAWLSTLILIFTFVKSQTAKR
jgi:apolipoprotein N-acyltransferase